MTHLYSFYNIIFLDLPVKPVRRSSAQILIIYTIIVSRSVGKMFFMFQISFLQGIPQKTAHLTLKISDAPTQNSLIFV